MVMVVVMVVMVVVMVVMLMDVMVMELMDVMIMDLMVVLYGPDGCTVRQKNPKGNFREKSYGRPQDKGGLEDLLSGLERLLKGIFKGFQDHKTTLC